MSIISASILLDQLTKRIAERALRGSLPRIYLGDCFRFDYVENSGAFLSLGAGLSSPVRFWLLSVAVALFLGGLLVYLLRDDQGMGKLQLAALSLILGGGASNLIDRLFRAHGRVIDFMNMGIGSLRTGVFNVADMLIMAGIFIFLVLTKAQPAVGRGLAKD